MFSSGPWNNTRFVSFTLLPEAPSSSNAVSLLLVLFLGRSNVEQALLLLAEAITADARAATVGPMVPGGNSGIPPPRLVSKTPSCLCTWMISSSPLCPILTAMIHGAGGAGRPGVAGPLRPDEAATAFAAWFAEVDAIGPMT